MEDGFDAKQSPARRMQSLGKKIQRFVTDRGGGRQYEEVWRDKRKVNSYLGEGGSCMSVKM
jgi:hypothetical protein